MLSKAISLPTLRHAAARHGMHKLLYAAGFGAALLPVIWAATSSFAGFVIIQVGSGVIWGAIEYAGFQLLLQGSADERRLEFLSIAGTLVGFGQVSGSLVGSLLLDHAHLSYPAVFCISSAVRGLPLLVTYLLTRATHVGRRA